jgi:hypothetical protein
MDVSNNFSTYNLPAGGAGSRVRRLREDRLDAGYPVPCRVATCGSLDMTCYVSESGLFIQIPSRNKV